MNRSLLAALLLIPAAANAADVAPATELERRTPIDPGAPRPHAATPVSRAELLNGIKLAAVNSARLPVVALELALPFGGTALDPDQRAGLASLTASLLTEGAGTRDADAFSDAVEDIGASFSVAATADALIVKVFTRRENLDQALALVADAVRRPTLPEASFDRLREEMLAGIAAKKAEPGAVAERRLQSRVFTAHPYGPTATEASVAALTHADALAAAERLADPRGARLTSAGNLSLDELRALADRHFGDWTKSGPLPALPATLTAPVAATPAGTAKAAPGLGIDVIDLPGSGQSAIRFGQLTVRRDHPDFYALRLAMEVLGGGTGRLHNNLREDKGWAYGAYAHLGAMRAAGEMSGQTDVQTDRTADAVVEIFAEMDKMRRELVPAAELQKAKLYVAGGLLRRQQKVQDVAGTTSGFEQMGLPADELTRYRDGLMAVTAEQVLEAAQRHLRPEAVHIVIAGDAEKVYAPLSALAPVKVFGIDGVEKPAPVKAPSNG